jgi:hypothetical protein
MTRVLERGELLFFYRPRVGVERVRGLGDVQRLFLVLVPEPKRLFRRLIVGRKRLPDPAAHEREWAFVAEVADDPHAIRDDLERVEYATRTRGTRVQPEARPAGEGMYAVVEHDGHTHLAYTLDEPREPDPLQQELGIRREASYIVAVRNPEAPAPPGMGLDAGRRADLPRPLKERFAGRRFAPLDPPDFLDHAGVELVLIGAAEHASRELGIDLRPEVERRSEADLLRRARPASRPCREALDDEVGDGPSHGRRS